MISGSCNIIVAHDHCTSIPQSPTWILVSRLILASTGGCGLRQKHSYRKWSFLITLWGYEWVWGLKCRAFYVTILLVLWFPRLFSISVRTKPVPTKSSLSGYTYASHLLGWTSTSIDWLHGEKFHIHRLGMKSLRVNCVTHSNLLCTLATASLSTNHCVTHTGEVLETWAVPAKLQEERCSYIHA